MKKNTLIMTALLLSLSFSAFAEDKDCIDCMPKIDFDLATFQGSKSISFRVLKDIEAKQKGQKNSPLIGDDEVIYIAIDQDAVPANIQKPENSRTMGVDQNFALKASRDLQAHSTCSSGHDQGDLANRWCHSALSRVFSGYLEQMGVDSTVASLAGGVFWVPKEYFYDLNPSASDLVVTYKDSLGTKRTTFEITVFGDAFFKKRPGEHFAPFKESAPFISIRRSLGGAPR